MIRGSVGFMCALASVAVVTMLLAGCASSVVTSKSGALNASKNSVPATSPSTQQAQTGLATLDSIKARWVDLPLLPRLDNALTTPAEYPASAYAQAAGGTSCGVLQTGVPVFSTDTASTDRVIGLQIEVPVAQNTTNDQANVTARQFASEAAATAYMTQLLNLVNRCKQSPGIIGNISTFFTSVTTNLISYSGIGTYGSPASGFYQRTKNIVFCVSARDHTDQADFGQQVVNDWVSQAKAFANSMN